MWNIQKARAHYNIAHWSEGYFDINAKGQVVALPNRKATKFPIVLAELIHDLPASGLSLPVLVRFTDILSDGVDRLCQSFRQAMIANEYKGQYHPIYPIKVNQQRRVIYLMMKEREFIGRCLKVVT